MSLETAVAAPKSGSGAGAAKTPAGKAAPRLWGRLKAIALASVAPLCLLFLWDFMVRRTGTRLIPLMDEGAKGIEELQKQARDLGLTVSSETAKDAAELNDTLNILWRVIKQGVFTIGGALAPIITSVAQTITRVVVSTCAWWLRSSPSRCGRWIATSAATASRFSAPPPSTTTDTFGNSAPPMINTIATLLPMSWMPEMNSPVFGAPGTGMMPKREAPPSSGRSTSAWEKASQPVSGRPIIST